MKVIQVHNNYIVRGGENIYYSNLINSLANKGIITKCLVRDSENTYKSLKKKISAFSNGIYSYSSKKEMIDIINEEKPDIVHIHNLYPQISPSILGPCVKAGIPIIMSCHNFRLFCPIGSFYKNNEICELCDKGHEYWCVIKNCRNSLPESIGYSLRSYIARKVYHLISKVSLFIAPSEFVKQKLVDSGIRRENIKTIPNYVNIPNRINKNTQNKYVGYVGRISPEKGIITLLNCAKRIDIPFKLAGDYELMRDEAIKAPPNVEFIGYLNKDKLDLFYRSIKIMVIPSECYETFNLSAAEAMSYGIPVVASRIGALAENIEDGITGLLYTPGNVDELVEKIGYLLKSPNKCLELGTNGRNNAIMNYGEEQIINQLINVYKEVLM